MREQAAALEYIADPASQQNGIGIGDVLARDSDGTGVGIDQPVGEP